jgi:hypothetical protein
MFTNFECIPYFLTSSAHLCPCYASLDGSIRHRSNCLWSFELKTLKPSQEVAKLNFLIVNLKQWKFTLLVSFQYFWLPKTKLNLIITSDLVKNKQDFFCFLSFNYCTYVLDHEKKKGFCNYISQLQGPSLATHHKNTTLVTLNKSD